MNNYKTKLKTLFLACVVGVRSSQLVIGSDIISIIFINLVTVKEDISQMWAILQFGISLDLCI